MSRFPTCAACGANDWQAHWTGPVRDGAFGRLTAATEVRRCGGCGVWRLAEDSCKDESFYRGADYRESLNEATTADGFFAEHDRLQAERLGITPAFQLRSKAVADVGCAAGSFLDHIRGLIRLGVAVEPAAIYHDSLRSRGYGVYPDLESAGRAHKSAMDYVFSYSVIEHVTEPLAFIKAMSGLMAAGGQLVLSTPNRGDILMQLLPDAYPSFFFRAVHRWYFDRESLARCAQAAGLEVLAIHCVHRFGAANAMLWLRDRAPAGRTAPGSLEDAGLDFAWRSHLERNFLGDYLYAVLRKPRRAQENIPT